MKATRQIPSKAVIFSISLLALLAAYSTAALAAEKTLFVSSQSLDVRTCPAHDCGVVRKLAKGSKIFVREINGDWVRISERVSAQCEGYRSKRIIEGDDRCVAPNGIIDGRYAGWVFSADVKAKKAATFKHDKSRPSWSTSTSKDKMTGKFSAYASSPTVYPSEKMGFPYHDVNSWMGVGCNGNSTWAYFGFSVSPNLSGDETRDGYNVIRTRVRWDKSVRYALLTQDWGSKFLHFREDDGAIGHIASSNKALLELQWHGQQKSYFEYPLNGSSKAIAEIRAKCKANR